MDVQQKESAMTGLIPRGAFSGQGVFAGQRILALGPTVSTNWPVIVRIYERNPTNGEQRVVAEVPVKRAEFIP